MYQIEVISVLLFLLHSNVYAQSDANFHRLHTVHPSIAIVVGVLSIMLSLTFLIVSCARFCHTNAPDGRNDEQGHQAFQRSRSRFSGIDSKVIESLPFFRFSSLKGSKDGLECVVCLSKFEDSETLRLLPKCRHAFHMNCIDTWLERHSSCPLCRYKFNEADLLNFTYTNSLRYPQSNSNLVDGSSLELFVKREGNSSSSRSSRFNLGNSFRKFGKGKKEELLIQYEDRKLLDKFKHRIIVSDIVCKSRWSDVNASDLMFLNSEMLNVTSNRRFSLPSSTSNNGRLGEDLSKDEHIMKVKEDMERKRLYDSKVSKITRSYSSISASNIPSTSNSQLDTDNTTMTRTLDPAQKRSMSEITNISRFREFSTRNGNKESLFSGNNEKDERIRSIWLPIAKRTIQWFAGRERSSLISESKKEPVNV